MPRPLAIVGIAPDSPAARAGLRSGDRLRALNGVPLADVIDLRFEAAEEEIEAEVESAGPNGAPRGGERAGGERAGVRTVLIERSPGEELGIEVEGMRPRTCANKCVFCFIDQFPRGGRRGLYVRDEDFRFSFLHGNYVTLTNIRERDLQRIERQGLGPLYVSVHATDPEVRARLLGIEPAAAAVMPVLQRLIAAGIRIHAQIVLCPGWNDGRVLDETLTTLAAHHPGIDSVAVVPLGLTRHRQGLPALAPVTADHAREVLAQGQAYQRRFLARHGRPLVYLADEWYFLTGTPIPPSAHYADFPQLEDGVGMTRQFIDRLAAEGDRLPIVERARGKRVTVVTAVMPAPVVAEALVDGLLARHAAAAELVVVENELLGPGITVSGLLAGGDIRRALTAPGRDVGDLVLLPPSCVNGRSLFLDDLALDDLVVALGAPVMLGLGDEPPRTNPVWEQER